MRALAVLAAIWLAAPAAAGCTEQWDRLGALLTDTGLIEAPLAAAPVTAADGCRLETPFVPLERMTLKAELLRWSGEGLERFEQDGLPPVSIRVALTGARVVPDLGDPVMSYIFDLQGTARTSDVFFDAAWDADANSLWIERATVVFPSGDHVRLRATVAGVDLSDQGALMASLQSFAVTSAEADVRSHGLFEQYLLMPLGLALLDRDSDPAMQVADLKTRAIAWIDALPGAVFPEKSRAELKQLVGEMPTPKGTLSIEMTADPGLGPVRGMDLVAALEQDPAALWSHAEGVRFDIEFLNR